MEIGKSEAARAEFDDMRDSRDELTQAIHGLMSAMIAVEGHLNRPYPEDPRWTPWSRFVEPALARLSEALGAQKRGPKK
jgi:hypothetical protein